MRFDKANEPHRILNLQYSLWSDFTIEWNPVRLITLRFRLINGSIDNLTQIDPKFVDGSRGMLSDFSFSKHE